MGEATPAAGERDGPGQLSPSSSALAVTPLTRTITSFNSASVRRSAVIVFAIAGALLLSLWLFEVARHFSFLVVLAWLFAIALEPGFRELVAHGRSRGIATTIMGGRCDPYDPSAGGSLRATVLQPDHGVRHDGPDAGHPCHRAGQRPVRHHARHHDHHVVAEPHSVAGPGFFATIAGWMPPHAQRVFLTVSEITIAKTGGNVISKIVLAALSAGFHAVSSVAIGVPCRLPFALFVGSTAQFVPIVGTYLGIILPVLATVFISPWKAIAIVAFAAVYQQIETYYVTPRVSKKTLDVNPAIALAAVLVGDAIWGLLGALIGIPLAAAGVAILDTYSKSYELVPEIAQASADSLPTLDVEPVA